jgi:putative glutamine amidotransferase
MSDGSSPRIALIWARSAASHSAGFSATLQLLAESALAAVLDAGGTPVPVDSAAGPIDAAGFSGVLVLGGGDIDPRRYGGNSREPTLDNICPEADAAELAVIQDAAGRGIPVLGICRGMQLINVAFGGSLHEDLGAGSVHRLLAAHPAPAGTGMAAHAVVVSPGTLLADALGRMAGPTLPVQSGHHQAVRKLGRGLRISAAAADGVIEAVERLDGQPGWLLGVQWHPEAPGTEPGQFRALLDSFLAAARQPERNPAGA